MVPQSMNFSSQARAEQTGNEVFGDNLKTHVPIAIKPSAVSEIQTSWKV